MDGWTITAIIATLFVAGAVLYAAFLGAVFLFAYASEQGFLGMAAYVACWVFAFPVMLTICIGLGFYLWIKGRVAA